MIKRRGFFHFLLCLITVLSATTTLVHADESEASYCLALRGNGTAMPAHWGAMSQIVLDKGLPKLMAGGSSASITMFLLESLSINPLLTSRSDLSLMVKSFQGYFEALAHTTEGQALQGIIGDEKLFAEIKKITDQMGGLDFSDVNLRIFMRHLENVEYLLMSDMIRSLINPEFVAYVAETLRLADYLINIRLRANSQDYIEQVEARIHYRRGEIMQAFENFGSFNAQTDRTLFFRPGLIDFSKLAVVLSHMADFYAGGMLNNSAAQEELNDRMRDFLQLCSNGSESLTWAELSQQRPQCQHDFIAMVTAYRQFKQNEGNPHYRALEKVGQHLSSLPTTSVITGDGAERFERLKGEYLRNTQLNFGQNFQVDQKDLFFGYWGSADVLTQVQEGIENSLKLKDDLKSQKFYSLGEATWMQALSFSPAEPGLARILRIRQGVYSAGGWSDLHPTLVLRAYGCENVVYVTRRGGESLFAQGVIKRLTDIDGFDWADWQGLSAEERFLQNAKGNREDVREKASTWSRLYNMANPESSLRRSMKAADLTVCTDWDRQSAIQDLNAMIEEAFLAPLLSDSRKLCI